jgi:hypothetical protein
MRQTPIAVAVGLFFSLAGCGGSGSGGPTADPASPLNPGNPDAPSTPTPIAQATVPRTAPSSIPPSALAGAVAANNAFAVDLYAHALSTTAGATSS